MDCKMICLQSLLMMSFGNDGHRKPVLNVVWQAHL